MNDVCETDEKSETDCLNAFQAVKNLILAINTFVFPPKVSNANRTFTCSHLIPVCPDKDAEGHSLPTSQWSCSSCFSLFNISISALKDPIEQLNRSAGDVLCREAGEECKSEFMQIVDIVGAVGKMFSAIVSRTKAKRPAVLQQTSKSATRHTRRTAWIHRRQARPVDGEDQADPGLADHPPPIRTGNLLGEGQRSNTRHGRRNHRGLAGPSEMTSKPGDPNWRRPR